MTELISTIPDNNIFHIFAFDIIKYYSPLYTSVSIVDNNIDKENKCQQWRKFVMEKIYNVPVSYTDKRISNRMTYSGYDCFNFIQYPPNGHIRRIVDKLCKPTGSYILLNLRKQNRVLYDFHTKQPLEEYINTKTFPIPFKWCNFDNMSVEEQYTICSDAALFISAHGAGCTNLIFTPSTCPLIEINFRKHWYCDPVCNDHFNGTISINAKCNGKLTYRNYFHKADYHNLCHLIGKKYHEIEAIEYAGRFLDRNPINKENVYIDADALVHTILQYIQ